MYGIGEATEWQINLGRMRLPDALFASSCPSQPYPCRSHSAHRSDASFGEENPALARLQELVHTDNNIGCTEYFSRCSPPALFPPHPHGPSACFLLPSKGREDLRCL